MAKVNQIHTVHRPSGWGNLSSGASKVPKIYPNKAEAQTAGRKTAMNQHAEHIVHNLNGKIASRNSYGKDPFPPKG